MWNVVLLVILCISMYHLQNSLWSVVENRPVSAVNVGLIPGLGRFHMPWGN